MRRILYGQNKSCRCLWPNKIKYMSESKLEIKLSYITGLRDIVFSEIAKNPNLMVVREDSDNDSIYLQFIREALIDAKHLRSIVRAYIVSCNKKYNPSYISNHKSILKDLMGMVIEDDEKQFKSFKISCSGPDSPEVRDIAKYIHETYEISEREEADLKIHIVKHKESWEIGAQVTPRPLSARTYRVVNMSGAMDSTIAYAVNSLCGLEQKTSYLNIFLGSATLLIEAGQCYPNLERLIGFDNDKGRLSLAIQNIKKADLVKKIQIKEADIFDEPNLGKFDAITADLPFGMSISKGEDLEKLYQHFIEYCENALNEKGKLVVYTSEHKILEEIIPESKFIIVKTLDLKFTTSVGSYLRPKIFVCEFK